MGALVRGLVSNLGWLVLLFCIASSKSKKVPRWWEKEQPGELGKPVPLPQPPK